MFQTRDWKKKACTASSKPSHLHRGRTIASIVMVRIVFHDIKLFKKFEPPQNFILVLARDCLNRFSSCIILISGRRLLKPGELLHIFRSIKLKSWNMKRWKSKRGRWLPEQILPIEPRYICIYCILHRKPRSWCLYSRRKIHAFKLG